MDKTLVWLPNNWVVPFEWLNVDLRKSIIKNELIPNSLIKL